MIKFILVDDDKNELEHIKSLLNEITDDDKEICCFLKVTPELKQEIQNTDNRKVYVLDIELGNSKVSGINIAKLIRAVDWESEIIFITNHDKMFESVHRSVYEVFDFIEKFHDFDKRFKKDVKEILNRKFDNKMFVYKANNIDLTLHYKYILYIYREKEERKLVIVTDNNKYKVNMSIKEIIPLLDARFKQCHRSCIVNTERVEEFNYKDGYFVLDTGEKVFMLSKKHRSEVLNV